MPGQRCTVDPCESQRKIEGISCYSFPRNDQVEKKWIKRCSTADKINTKHAWICSLHFLPSDYERNLKANF